MTRTLNCTPRSCPIFYEIEIRSGLLHDKSALTEYLTSLAPNVVLITDDTVARLYGEPLQRLLEASGMHSLLFSFPGGEQSKTRETKASLEERMWAHSLGRDTALIALGGGVVTDIGGYLAATYCRGIPLVMMPTSLLGMVDASIGGKTGVNTPYGKNLLGCHYLPKKVWIDPATLQSLPMQELKNGVVEMVKHAVICDKYFFEYLEQHAEGFLTLDPLVVETAIGESCRIKKEIVEEDEKEAGKRHLLNFGHTVGHALEHVTHYALSHGEAVAIGMLVEGYLAVRIGVLDKGTWERITCTLLKYGLSLTLPAPLAIDKVRHAMTLDKKSRSGRPRFVLIDQLGSCLACDDQYCAHVDECLITEALMWMNDALCGH